MAAVSEVRQTQARDPDQAVDVRLEHDLLVRLRRLVEGVAAERKPGAVDDDVEAAELGRGPLDEALAARGIGDVELERDLRVDPLDATSPAGHAHSLGSERAHDRGADPARRAGDDRAPCPRGSA